MPAIIAFFARQLIIIGVQLGIFSLMEKIVVPIINRAIAEIVSFFGVDEKEAEKILANEVIETAEALGLTVALSKARLPLAIADRLGFTTSGFAKKKLAASTEAAITKAKNIGKATTVIEAEIIEATSKGTAAAKGILSAKVKDVISLIGFVVGLPTAVLYMAAQYIDYATWQGSAYQKTFQKVLGIFGIEPDKKMPKSDVLSDEMWKKIKGVFEEAGVTALNDPYKNQTVMFSVETLKDLIDKIATHIILEKGDAKFKDVIGTALALAIIKKDMRTVAPSAQIKTEIARPAIQQVKVFTGIISQGKLAETPVFTARPDDLIESIEELQNAAQNNLAVWSSSLWAKIFYELKIVSSVLTRDGFRQRGTTQQIISGYFKNGAAKFKTVINKFAVLDIFIFNDKNIRSKISQIVLGPIDSVKLQIGTNTISEIEKKIKEETFTAKISEIQKIETAQPIAIAPQAALPEKIITAQAVPPAAQKKFTLDNSYYVQTGQWNGEIFKTKNGRQYIWDRVLDVITIEELHRTTNLAEQLFIIIPRLKNMGINVDTMRKVTFIGDEPGGNKDRLTETFDIFFTPGREAAPVPVSSRVENGLPKTTTLWEWYTAQGLALPSVEKRSKIYEEKGLGKAAYYTGTAEQNFKLLNKLQE